MVSVPRKNRVKRSSVKKDPASANSEVETEVNAPVEGEVDPVESEDPEETEDSTEPEDSEDPKETEESKDSEDSEDSEDPKETEDSTEPEESDETLDFFITKSRFHWVCQQCSQPIRSGVDRKPICPVKHAKCPRNSS